MGAVSSSHLDDQTTSEAGGEDNSRDSDGGGEITTIFGPEPSPLTSEEKRLIRESWKDVETCVACVGVVMFTKLFETHPDVQESFMSFRGVALKEMKQSQQLRNHALRVMGFVQKAVARLDEPEKLRPLAQELGRKHSSYGVSPNLVDLMGPQFVHAIQTSLEKEWESGTEEAWLRLFQRISYMMKSKMKNV